jgi:hypothetical protein
VSQRRGADLPVPWWPSNSEHLKTIATQSSIKTQVYFWTTSKSGRESAPKIENQPLELFPKPKEGGKSDIEVNPEYIGKVTIGSHKAQLIRTGVSRGPGADGMASKRHHQVDYAEDSYSDDEDDYQHQTSEQQQQQMERARPGRPRKFSVTTNSSYEAEMSFTPSGGVASPTATTTGASGQVRRRGRGPSKRPCLNRNALMARENRQRKKEYIERIESKLQTLQLQNQDLNSTIKKQSVEIRRLTNEVTYLKTVLNNNTVITSLLKSMNETLQRMHGDGKGASVCNTSNGLAKNDLDAINDIISGQKNSTKSDITAASVPGFASNQSSEAYKEDRRQNFSQISNPTKIARKTMPLTNCTNMPKTENPSSVESLFDDEDLNLLQKSSPECGNHCEYNKNAQVMELNKQLLPATPTSGMSNSMDKDEASLSDTNFSHLSTFNVDLFNDLERIDELASPLKFEQDADIFREETLFNSFDQDPDIITRDTIDPLEIGRMSDALNEKTMFNSLDTTGVCLHINSKRVSLEHCAICYYGSNNCNLLS